MANNPYVNKVVYGGTTLIDTSDVTVTPNKLAKGYTALDASGATIVGTANFDGENVWYGTCSTAASTQAKTVSITGIVELYSGLCIRIAFANAQDYNGAPTLNLNSLGAKTIRRYANVDSARYEWEAGQVLDLVYNGTVWIIVNGTSPKAITATMTEVRSYLEIS